MNLRMWGAATWCDDDEDPWDIDESIYHGFLRLVACVFSDHAPDKNISCHVVFSDHVSPFNVSPFGLLSGNIVAKGGVVVWNEEFSSKTTDSSHTCCMHDIVLKKWITYEYDVVLVFGECVLIHTYLTYQLTMKWNKLGMIEVTTLKVTDIYGANLMRLKSHVDIGYLLWMTVLCTLPFWLLFGQSGFIQICVVQPVFDQQKHQLVSTPLVQRLKRCTAILTFLFFMCENQLLFTT